MQFDGKLKLGFHRAKIMDDAGLLPFRGPDEAFRLTEKGSAVLSNPRPKKSTQDVLPAKLRQSVFGRLAGHEDVNDAERLQVNPVMRRIVGGRAKEKATALTRPDGQEPGRERPLSFGSDGLSAYIGGLEFDKWEMSV